MTMKQLGYLSVLLLGMTLLLLSCQGRGQAGQKARDSIAKSMGLLSPYATNEVEDEMIEIPYQEAGSVKYVDVTINGSVTQKAVFDTGAGSTCVSLDEANYLFQQGKITAEDFQGKAYSRVASGDIVEGYVFRINELKLSDELVFRDIDCVVNSSRNAPFLLGQDILNQVASYQVDNTRGVIRFELK